MVRDSPLLGRQDLINYFANIDPNFGKSNPTYSAALPYLGTFSRASTAPSWSPPSDAATLGGNNGTGSVYAYHTNAETALVNGTNNPNRDIPNARYANGGTVTHYNDDGTMPPRHPTVQTGDPIVQRRFSLAKLAWLGHNGPDTTNTTFASTVTATQRAQAILACFGLAWDSTALCWDYDHTDSDPTTRRPPTTSSRLIKSARVEQRRVKPIFLSFSKAGISSGIARRPTGPVAAQRLNDHDRPGRVGFRLLLRRNGPACPPDRGEHHRPG